MADTEDTGALRKMSEINEGLADINKTNQEILKQLDRLEDKQKRFKQWKQQQQRNQQTEEEQVDTSDLLQEKEATVDHSELTVEGPSTPQTAGDANTPKETIPGEGIVDMKENSDSSLQSATIATSGQQWKRMKGFTERFKLTEKHVMYGSVLKRNLTDMCQDNRLCEQFGVRANTGRTYESLVKPDTGVPLNEHDKDAKSKQLRAAERRQIKPKTKPLGDKRSDTKGEVKPRMSTHHSKPDIPASTAKRPPNVQDAAAKERALSRLSTSKTNADQGAGVQTMTMVMDPNTGKPTVIQGNDMLQLGAGVLQAMSGYAGNEKDAKLFQGLSEMAGTMSQLSAGGGNNPADIEKMIADAQNMGGVVMQFDPQTNTMKISNTEQLKEQLKVLKQALDDPDVSFSDRKTLADMIKLMDMVCDEDRKEIDLNEWCMLCTEAFKDNPALLELQNESMKQLLGATTPQLTTPEAKPPVLPVMTTDPAVEATATATKSPPRREVVKTVQTKSHQKLEQEKQKDDKAQRVYMNEGLWSEYANEEVAKAKFARQIREKGMDTIFCLDLSESMKGVAWDQASTFIRGFIEGIQNTTLPDDVYEHVALVTFGSETKVQQHLTCDYFEVTRKLERLQPGGPSPLFAGLTMAWAAVLGAGSVFSTNGYKIHPRIFLLTDGKVTPASLIAGPDSCTPMESESEKDKIMSLTLQLHKEHKLTIHSVPVGEFDLSLIEKIANSTEGKIVSPEDWVAQSSTFKNYMSAAEVGPHITAPELTSLWLNLACGSASATDQVQMEEFLRTHKRDDSGDGDVEIATLLPLGSRVRRNANLSDSFLPQLGTVTQHMIDGHIGVTWDIVTIGGSKREKVVYGNGIYGVVVEDDPRILGDDELIDVGCRVRRGQDWHYGDQDGGVGTLGSVFHVDEHGLVKVRWDSGEKAIYRFGLEAKFELEVVQQTRGVAKEERKDAPTIEEMNMRNVEEMNKRNASGDPTYANQSKDKPAATTNRQRELITEATQGSKLRGAVSSDTITQAQTIGHIDTTEHRRLGGMRSDVIRTTDHPGLRESSITERRNQMNRSDFTHVSDILVNRSIDQSENNSQTSANTKHIDTSSGTRPKAYQNSKTDASSGPPLEWLWLDGDVWDMFPPDISNTIETKYQTNPKGSVLITLDSQQYRIVFSRMERVNVATKEKCQVTRLERL